MKEIDFDLLVSLLTANRGRLTNQKFQVNRKTFNIGFAKENLDGCLIIEDWERYYKFDAAKDYKNPSVFVAECIIEEVMNKLELEAAYEEVMNKLEEKHSKG